MRFLLLILLLVFVPVAAKAQPALETLAKEAYIQDFETGQVLFAKNAEERMPTSSMSKTMTMYMVFEALKNGKLSLDQQLPVSEKAWRMQGSKMFVPLGQMVKVEDLIRGVIIQSGNDATIVLAEGIAGSEEAFAEAMNRKAQELGMVNSHFMNASGWPDPDHYSTCHDLAILGKALIRDFPDYYRYYSEIDFTYNNIKQGNRNPLLYKNIGADGIKTGHSEAAGYGLMASAQRDGRRIIMVLNGMSSMNERAQEATRLMEWAQVNFTNRNIVQAGMKVADAPVAMGVERSVPLIVDKDVKVTLPRMAAGPSAKAQAVFKAPLEAPVKKGQEVGVLRVEVANMQPMELPILAAKDIPKKGFFPGLVEKIERLIFGESVPKQYDAPVNVAPASSSEVAPATPAQVAPTPAPASVPAPATAAPSTEAGE
jgi:D-alanyl-D-alanine carboxypeptidase (penicillin-binding protein 5/6)